METRVGGEGATEASGRNPSFTDLIDAIKNLAAHNARAPLESEEQIWLFLTSWWSRTYNRPLKDPLLKEYTLEELLYEFYDRIERDKASEEMAERTDGKIEEAKEKEALDWAELEEKKELEELARKEGKASAEEVDPTKDPANQKWMEEQLAQQKKLLGDDFGENLDFSMDE